VLDGNSRMSRLVSDAHGQVLFQGGIVCLEGDKLVRTGKLGRTIKFTRVGVRLAASDSQDDCGNESVYSFMTDDGGAENKNADSAASSGGATSVTLDMVGPQASAYRHAGRVQLVRPDCLDLPLPRSAQDGVQNAFTLSPQQPRAISEPSYSIRRRLTSDNNVGNDMDATISAPRSYDEDAVACEVLRRAGYDEDVIALRFAMTESKEHEPVLPDIQRQGTNDAFANIGSTVERASEPSEQASFAISMSTAASSRQMISQTAGDIDSGLLGSATYGASQSSAHRPDASQPQPCDAVESGIQASTRHVSPCLAWL